MHVKHDAPVIEANEAFGSPAPRIHLFVKRRQHPASSFDNLCWRGGGERRLGRLSLLRFDRQVKYRVCAARFQQIMPKRAQAKNSVGSGATDA